MALFQGQSLNEWKREEQCVIMLFFFSTSGVLLKSLPLKCSPESKGIAPNTVSVLRHGYLIIEKYQSMLDFSFSQPRGSNNYLNTTVIMYSIKTLSTTEA